LWRNNITGSRTAGAVVTDGGRLLATGNVAAVQENFISGGAADGISIKSDAGAVGSIFDNDLSGNAGFAVDNGVANVTVNAQANWWGSTSAAVVAGKVKGLVTVTPFLLFGTDTQPATPGFQGDFRGGLRFDGQPSNALSGQVIAPPVTVTVLDIFGNPLTTGSTAITLAVSPNAAGATLGGTTVHNSAGGSASFGDLFVLTPGTFTLTASATGLPPATSQGFTITAAVGSRLIFTTQPGTVVAGAFLPPIIVQVADQFGNPVAQAGVSVTISLTAGVLYGTRTLKTNAAGVAVFSNLQVFSTGSFVLKATAANLASALSQPFLVIVNPNAVRRRWL
jgi:hypothetical protein